MSPFNQLNIFHMKKLFSLVTISASLLFLICSCKTEFSSSRNESGTIEDAELSRKKYYAALHDFNNSNIDRYDQELIESYQVPRLNSFLNPLPNLDQLKYLGVNTVSIGSNKTMIDGYQKNGFQLLITNKPHTNEDLLEEYPETHQVIFGCSEHVKANGSQLNIDLQTQDSTISYKGDDYWRTNPEALNYAGDKYWRVFDVTEKRFLDRDQWERDQATSIVEIHNTIPGHKYGVLYQTKQIHVWIAKKGTINPMFEGIEDVFIDWHKERYAPYKGILNVYRPTSASIHRGGGWFGYLCGTNPQILDEFGKWAGEAFDPAWTLSDDFQLKGLGDEPHPGMLKWMSFVQEKMVSVNKNVNSEMHKYVPVLRLFWGDNWIGLEPWLGDLERAGFDEVTKGAHNSVVMRMITGFPGPTKRNFRFSPWINELQFFNPDLYGESPVQYARKNWNEIRRALFFEVPDGMELGGNEGTLYSKNNTGSLEQLKQMVDEYLFTHHQTHDSKVFTHDLDVYIINSYGALRSWIGWGGEFFNNDPLRFQFYLTDLPINVHFISMEKIISKGIPADADVLINYGDAGSAWSGGSAWDNELLGNIIRSFVNKGGGFIGVGNPSSARPGESWVLSDLMGVDLDSETAGISSMDKTSDGKKHWITTSLPEKIDQLNNDVKVKIVSNDVKILYEKEGTPMLTTRTYGEGRVVYLSSYALLPPKSPETWNLNPFSSFDYPYDIGHDFYDLVRRSIFWSAGQEENLKKIYSPDENVSVYAYPEKHLLIAYNRTFKERVVTLNTDPELFKLNAKSYELYDVLEDKILGSYSGKELKNGIELKVPAEGAGFIRISESD
jgi:1,3-beta-galactosyl-N-acetylhexosamine phosphorylase